MDSWHGIVQSAYPDSDGTLVIGPVVDGSHCGVLMRGMKRDDFVAA